MMIIIILLLILLLMLIIFNFLYFWYINLHRKQIIELHERLQELEEDKKQKELQDYIKETVNKQIGK